MKSISVTVGILILTVFLSLSAPAYAEAVPSYPYTVYGYANYTDGTPAADGESVLIYKLGDPSNNTTALVGVGFEDPGWWKANLNEIHGGVTIGDIIVVEVIGVSTTYVIDTSLASGGQWLSEPVTPLTTNDDSDANDGSSSGGGRDGTYPPEPTAAATPAPTAAPEPTVASTKATTEDPTKAPTKAPTVESTEIETTELKTEGTPGFGAVLTVFAIAGLLVAAYLVMRRRE